MFSDRTQACGCRVGDRRRRTLQGLLGHHEDIHSVKGSTEGLKPRPKMGRNLAKVPEG